MDRDPPPNDFVFTFEPLTVPPAEDLYTAFDDAALICVRYVVEKCTTVTCVYVVRDTAGT